MNNSRQIKGLGAFVFVLACVLILTTACGGSGVVGKWEKVPAAASNAGGCFDSFYPSSIEFFGDGTYAGQMISMWNGGKYSIIDSQRIKLDTVQGGLAAYQFSISGNFLTFTDEKACKVTYQRSK